MSETQVDKLFKLFHTLGLRYKVIKHPNLVTVKDMLEEPSLAGFRDDCIRNLFMLDSSKRYYLISALYDTEVNWKVLRKSLNVNKLHMGDESDMLSLLGVGRGNLTPFSAMNDTENKVHVLFDIRLKNKVDVVAHPLTNDQSVVMKMEDMLKFLTQINHFPTFLPLNDLDSTTHATDKTVNSVTTVNSVNNVKKGEVNILGITVKKYENFPEWYSQVIVRSEMIEYYDISGCYIFLPASYFIWEIFNEWFNKQIKQRGVDNCYFPMFVTKERLEAEKTHLEGFSPEVAWVTRNGDVDFPDPIAIRPTSETIMYPEFSKWIRSYRDLPLKLNQWNSVVRWEFKQPTPFIRSREFLWQEGHTAHSTEKEALDTVYEMLDLYSKFYEEYLSVPVIKGVKSENEKFAGSKMTTSLEAFVPANGRGVQAATSHLLGTTFSDMFDIKYEDEEGEKRKVHQTSWGFTTRSIGIMIMVHGDDRGLVVPPRVAKTQVVIVPILTKTADQVISRVNELYKLLTESGFRVKLDDRRGYTPGFKFNHWELRGVPLRLEVGAKDVENNTVRLVRRDNFAKADVPLENLTTTIQQLLDQIQNTLLTSAREKMEQSIVKAYDFEEVMVALNNDKLIMAPWCEEPGTEDEIKQETQKRSENSAGGRTGAMKSLCIPFDQPEMPEGTKCFWTGKPAKRWTLWGRSY
ncbi:proline--tRNA ligase [Theileria parva strain Muguga]|uniref:proline--tRNA ligase n=1 Tax=Theileria parva strain Muguga TaxID=333668 RepID=UPI001C62364A|nr:proline--tRNA ligase [Theileria parva strain Muguga]EAN33410.2 proline--tRNA ligase [Theileria parva strain Muguga]